MDKLKLKCKMLRCCELQSFRKETQNGFFAGVTSCEHDIQHDQGSQNLDPGLREK